LNRRKQYNRNGGKNLYLLNYRQVLLKNIYTDCQDLFLDQKHSFFRLMEEHIDLGEFIPVSFTSAFNQNLGRNHKHV